MQRLYDGIKHDDALKRLFSVRTIVADRYILIWESLNLLPVILSYNCAVYHCQ